MPVSEPTLLVIFGLSLSALGVFLNYLVRSRCSKLSICCKAIECEREVVSGDQAITLDTSTLQTNVPR